MIRIQATRPGLRWLKIYQMLIPEIAKDIGRTTMLKVPCVYVDSNCAKETIEHAMEHVWCNANKTNISIVQLVNQRMAAFLPKEENVKYNPVYVRDMPFDETTNTGEMWLVDKDTLCPVHVIRIEGLRDEQKHWIPITKRLPEELESVLVTVKGGSNDYEEEDDWVKESWLSSMPYNIWESDPTLEVIAWRPLPEPHRREDKEE